MLSDSLEDEDTSLEEQEIQQLKQLESEQEIQTKQQEYLEEQALKVAGGKKEGIQEVYKEILDMRKKIIETQGMSRFTFFIGIMNIAITCFVVGYCPQYYWLMFIFKIYIVFPARLYVGLKNKDNYYLTDFCWISIAFTAISFLFMIFGKLEPQNAQQIMRIVFVFATGPQGWSAVIFNNTLVLHSFIHTCSVFIHLSPVIASYTLRWNLDQINAMFPNLVPFDGNSTSQDFFGDLYIPSFKCYLIWFVVYSTWLSFHGLKLPKRGYDTVFNWLYTSNKGFHNFLDKVAAKYFKKEKDVQTKSKVMIFMCMHFLMINCTMLWSYVCYNYQIAHFLFMVALLCSVSWQASGFYIYQSLNGSKKLVEKIMDKYEIEYEKDAPKQKRRLLKRLQDLKNKLKKKKKSE